MFGLGISEIAIILFIALIFIGPKKLPELARGLGKGIREFQNAAKGIQESIKSTTDEVKTTTQSVTQVEDTAPRESSNTNTQV